MIPLNHGTKYLRRTAPYDFTYTTIEPALLYTPPGESSSDVEIFNPAEYGAYQWTTDSAARVDIWSEYVISGAQDFQGIARNTAVTFDFESPEIGSAEAASAEVTITFAGYHGEANSQNPDAFVSQSVKVAGCFAKGDFNLYLGDGSASADAITYGAELDNAATEELQLTPGLYGEVSSADIFIYNPAALLTNNFVSIPGFYSTVTTTTEPLAELFAVAGNYNAVPMIMGANRDEDRSAMANDKEFVSLRFGVLPSIKDHERYQRYSNYYADRWHSTGVSQMARLMTGANPEVGIYGYRFDWDETPINWPVNLPELLGAGHGLEVSFVFNDFVGGLRLPFLYGEDSEPGREKLSRAIMNYWGRFAHSGTPGTGLLQKQPEWTAWQETGANIMVLDSPADGGWRMEHYYPSPEATMQRIESDTAISSQQERCKLFVESFLLSYHSSDYWDSERYLSLSGGGCAEYDPYKFEGIF